MMNALPVRCLLLALVLLGSVSAVVSAVDMTTPAFDDVWSRTDRPVAEGVVDRTWMWGPKPITPVMPEPYAESPGAMRQVQYFDKSRMEITQPESGDPDSIWYVTNGLLAVELVTGNLQTGDHESVQRLPAEINIAGDQGFVNGPTYASFPWSVRTEYDEPNDRGDALVIERVSPAGGVTTDQSLETQAVRLAAYDESPTTISPHRSGRS